MKLTAKATLILTSLLAASTLSACGQSTLPAQMPQTVRYQAQAQAPQKLLVRFRSQFQMDRSRMAEFNAKYGLHIGEFLPALNVYVVEIDPQLGLRPERVASYLQNDPMVEHAEVNYAVQIQPVGEGVQLMPIK